MGAPGARVMRGEDTARIPIAYDLPKRYAVNLTALAGLRDAWEIPPELVQKAGLVIRK